MNHVLRAHQLCMEGYSVLYDDRLSTVWSAPNYCYRYVQTFTTGLMLDVGTWRVYWKCRLMVDASLMSLTQHLRMKWVFHLIPLSPRLIVQRDGPNQQQQTKVSRLALLARSCSYPGDRVLFVMIPSILPFHRREHLINVTKISTSHYARRPIHNCIQGRHLPCFRHLPSLARI